MELGELIAAIERTINGETHSAYDETLAIERFARAVWLEVGQDAMILVGRENADQGQKDKIIALTKSITRLCLSPIYSLYNKIFRVDGVRKDAQHDSKDDLIEIERLTGAYYQKKDVEAFLQTKFLLLNFIDPNAWHLVEQRRTVDVESVVTVESVYPFIVSSKQAINYAYQNGNPIWLVVQRTRRVMLENGSFQDVDDFYLYAANYVLEYRDALGTLPDQYEGTFVSETSTEYYTRIHVTGTTEFPGAKVGAYDKDERPDVKETPFAPANGTLRDIVPTKARFDLTKEKHFFAKKYIYNEDCPRCGGDGRDEGRECPSCKGSGRVFHENGLDIIEFNLPDNKSDLIPLRDLVHYEDVPVDMVRYYSEELERMRINIQLAVFNTIVQDRNIVAKTATEIIAEWEEVNNRCFAFAQTIAHHEELVWRITAQYLEKSDGFKRTYAFNTDLKLKPLDILLAQYQKMKEIGMSYDALWSVYCDILEKQHVNNPQAILDIKARERFRPWRSRTFAEISMILSARSPEDHSRFVYENFDEIFDEVERNLPTDANGLVSGFGALDYSKQKELFDAAVTAVRETVTNYERPALLNEL